MATTNLLEGIDPAALRRFDLKVRFDALRAEQAWELLCRHCTLAGLPEPHSGLRAAIAHIAGGITPGDFAVVARRSRFQKFSDAGAWVTALQGECEHKPKTSAPIGFVTELVKRA